MKIKRYIVSSHNDGTGGSLRTKCFDSQEDAFIYMVNDAMQLVIYDSSIEKFFEIEKVCAPDGMSLEYHGVTYEWNIDETLIELTDSERRLAHYELEDINIIDDIDSLIAEHGMGYILSDADKKFIKSRYTSKHDWTLPDDAQLLVHIYDKLSEKIPLTRFIVGFNENDETEFEATSLKELDTLWKDFCKENDLEPFCIDYYEPIEVLSENAE